MALTSITIQIPEKYLATFDEIATNMSVDRNAVLRDAIEEYLAGYRQECADAEQADRDYEAGNTYTHEEVMARHEQWVAETLKKQERV